MENIDMTTCKPAFIYFIIMLILICTKTIIRLKFRPFNLVALGGQLGSMVLCTIISIGICNFSCKISWVMAIILIMFTLCELVIAVRKWIAPKSN